MPLLDSTQILIVKFPYEGIAAEKIGNIADILEYAANFPKRKSTPLPDFYHVDVWNLKIIEIERKDIIDRIEKLNIISEDTRKKLLIMLK